jgi:hypothetical protein
VSFEAVVVVVAVGVAVAVQSQAQGRMMTACKTPRRRLGKCQLLLHRLDLRYY